MSLAGELGVRGVGVGIIVAIFAQKSVQVLVEKDQEVVDHVVGDFADDAGVFEGCLMPKLWGGYFPISE